MNDCRNRVCVRAAAGPDRYAGDLNFDRPGIGLGLASRRFLPRAKIQANGQNQTEDPQISTSSRWPRDTANGHPNRDIDELLPWAYRKQDLKAVA